MMVENFKGREMMSYKINVGDKMPIFKAKDSFGHTFSSDDLMGGPVVIYFYPKDDTPGCTKEACSFRDNLDNLDEYDAILVGISPDGSKSHESFIEKHDLNFTLLSDESLDVCRKFDVIRENNVDGKKVPSLERTTFVIDAQGTIRWIERPVAVDGHTERVIKALKEIAGP
jgi:thioredoxin-dependent peroxiredoxin